MVVNQPQGSPGWFPVNDTPRDKATFDFAVSVPAESTVMGNGVLLSHRTHGARTTWRWLASTPMALATVTNSPFESVGGIIDNAPEVGYHERHGGPSAQETFDELYAPPAADNPDLWSPPPPRCPAPRSCSPGPSTNAAR
jgi:hypothetical protein